MAGPTTARRGAAKNGKSKSSGTARSSGSAGPARRPKPSRSPSSGTPRRGRAPRRSGPIRWTLVCRSSREKPRPA
ncbi:hypothetical protein ACLMMR_19225, partial [Streptomyces sp. NPDC000405]